jgi:hypothetical protein
MVAMTYVNFVKESRKFPIDKGLGMTIQWSRRKVSGGNGLGKNNNSECNKGQDVILALDCPI